MKSFRTFLFEDVDTTNIFSDLIKLVTLVAKGVRRSLFVYGNGGTGKTYTVMETLNNMGLKQNKDWYMFTGKITTLGLYRELFLLRHDKIIIFDDADTAFDNPDSSALLKAALDTQARSLNWFSSRTTNVTNMDAAEKEAFNHKVEAELKTNPSGDTVKFPSEFFFTSRVIFISNLARDQMDQAVLTRVLKIDVSLNIPQIFKRMAELIHKGQLGPKDMDLQNKVMVLNTLIRLYNQKRLKQPSLRTFVAAAELQHKGEKDWTTLLQYT